MPDADTIIIPQAAADTALTFSHFDAPAAPAPVMIAGHHTPDPSIAYMQGLEPVPRPLHTGNDPGMTALIIALLLGVLLCFNTLRRRLSGLTDTLTRQRPSTLDSTVQPTAGEHRVLMFMRLITALLLAIPAAAALHRYSPAHIPDNLTATLLTAVLAIALYIFDLAACAVTAYTFAPPGMNGAITGAQQAAQVLMSPALLVPALTVLFYPAYTTVALWATAIIYATFRILVIIKGFRIFYTNPASLFYFILYLCSVEITPVITGYAVACRFIPQIA